MPIDPKRVADVVKKINELEQRFQLDITPGLLGTPGQEDETVPERNQLKRGKRPGEESVP